MEKLNELVALAEKADKLCLLMMNVNPHTILAIAEAFRELERISDTNMAAAQAMRDDMYHWKQRAEAAEAKLAELQKQEPAAFTSEYYWSELNTFGVVKSVLLKNGNDPDFQVELFTRAAPAADLAGLVPSEFPAIRLQKAKLWIDRVLMDKPGMKEAQTISAILRNIEEAK